jgi:DNA-binding Lrp family transcriptional regulator
MPTLDRIDRTLMAALQNNARISNKELAALVGLAPSSCLSRVRKLESDGAIRAYRAELDTGALGLGLQALIAVQLRLHVGKDFGTIGTHLRSLPEAVAVYCLGGATDFLVHVVCRDTEHLRVLTIESFTSRPEVARIETSLVFAYSALGVRATANDDREPGSRGTAPRAPRRRASRRR